LAWWRGLKAKAATAGQVLAVAGGLRRLGRQAEAIAFIEARYPLLRERDPAQSRPLRSELVAYYRQQRQPAKMLSLFPEIRLFDLEVEPEAVRHLNLAFPSDVWEQLLARFVRGGRSQPAFITRSAALLAT